MRIMTLGNGTELHIHDDHFSVYTEGFRLLDLFVESAVNKPDESDLDKEIHLIEINNSSVRWKAVSRLWEEKLYLLKKTKSGFLFSVSVSFPRASASSCSAALKVRHASSSAARSARFF